jgi:hypothetical protein
MGRRSPTWRAGNGVTRQTVHRWLRRYANEGWRGLVDGSAKPLSCPHQMPPEVEARIVELRREQPGWGPRTIGHQLEAVRVWIRCRVGRRSIGAWCVMGLIARRRASGSGRTMRWERSRAMELWQMDIVGGVIVGDGSEAKIVSGIDDHSPVRDLGAGGGAGDGSAGVRRWRWRCARHGCPRDPDGQRQGVHRPVRPGTGEVLFDRICRENGIKHLLTAPRSPTTTGKVERWHKTLRVEFLTGKVFDVIADAQASSMCGSSTTTTTAAPGHRDGGTVGTVPTGRARRHDLAKQTAGLRRRARGAAPASQRPTASAVSVTRKVDSSGNVSFAGSHYRAGNAYRRRRIQVAVVGDHVELSIGEELIRRHPIRHDRTREHGALANPGGRPRRINAA